jgi:hypothetical protein
MNNKNRRGTLQRTDGCAANGVPDGNGVGRDWVETCIAQLESIAVETEPHLSKKRRLKPIDQ